MFKSVSFARGMIVHSREEALKRGLAVPNSDEDNDTVDPVSSHIPKGLFFTRNAYPKYRQVAEKHAKLFSSDTPKKPIAFAIHLTVTEDTFPLLQNRMYRITTRAPLDSKNSYVPIASLGDLEVPSNMAIIDLSGLAHEDLVELGIEVGSKEGEAFQYKSYAAWAEELGVKTKTREEILAENDGKNPQWRK